MPYVPNATQTTEPVESQTVESAALEFRTLKTRVNSLEDSVATADLTDLRVPEASVAVLPAIADRAGKVLGFDAGGDPTMVEVAGATDPSLRADLADPASGASLVGYLSTGTGAVATTVQAKLRESVSVLDFGAVGDGDITAALIAANAELTASGGGDINLPKGSYFISNVVTLGAGVNLIGPGKITRTHGLSVANYAFRLQGNNTIRGVIYDGGALSIVTPGLALSIKDFMCEGDNITIEGNTFTNSIGSFIGFVNEQYAVLDKLRNIRIANNFFGDYFDHAIYCQGYKLVETGDIAITSNTFTGLLATTTRQAIKIKNNSRVAVQGNTFNLPTGVFITVECGLDAIECLDSTEVTISGNTGYAFRFFESIADLTALNRGYMNKQITVTGNTAFCTGAVVSVGLSPQDSTVTYATRCKNMAITGNTFVGSRFTINGDINGVNNGIEDLTISNNSIQITTGNTVFQTYGNIKHLVITNNVLQLDTAYNAGNAVINRNGLVDSFWWSNPTITGYFEISKNTLLGGFGSILTEQPGSANTSINFVAVLDGNRMINANTQRTVVLSSAGIPTATGRIYAQNNKFFGGTVASPVAANYTLYTETDDSKRYVDPATTGGKQGGRNAIYVCSLDLGFDPLTLGAGVYYQAFKKADGTYVRVA